MTCGRMSPACREVFYPTLAARRSCERVDRRCAAFSIYEDGRRQQIALFRKDDVPVSIGLLIDNSGSMRSKRGKVEAAALAFVGASNPLDEVFVVNFADKVRVDVPMSNDVRVLERGIARGLDRRHGDAGCDRRRRTLPVGLRRPRPVCCWS